LWNGKFLATVVSQDKNTKGNCLTL